MMGVAPSGRPDGGVPTDRQACPILSRLILGVQLRRLREERSISRAEAGAAIHVSESKISRLELGHEGNKIRDVAALCTLYGVIDHAERTTLLGLARQANRPQWWQAYGDLVPGWFETYLGLEQTAQVIRGYEVQFVPGLLQTPDYARAVIMLGHGNASPEEVYRRVELRMHRQRILHRPVPTRFWAVIDEAALRRQIGGPATMFRQLVHLMDMCELPQVTVQVLPFSAGGHAAGGGPVTLLRLPEPRLPEFVYLEQLASAVYPTTADDVDFYRHILNRLAVQAEPAHATPAILRQLIDSL
jgi:transcriptional regulator with XRE-family HTH domain